jgi:hypothetical protein
MHASYSIYSSLMRHTFKLHHRVLIVVNLFTIAIFTLLIVVFQSLAHLTPFHGVDLVVLLRKSLRASTEIHCVGELIMLVL